MDIGPSIFYQLSNDPTAGPLLADEANGYHIYPLTSVQNLYPLVAYTFTDETEEPLRESPVLRGPFITSIVIATLGYDDTAALADAVFNALNKKKWTNGVITIRACNYQHNSQDAIAEVSNAEMLWYEVEQVYKIFAYAN